MASGDSDMRSDADECEAKIRAPWKRPKFTPLAANEAEFNGGTHGFDGCFPIS